MRESDLPVELRSNSLLHFESGVPIDDLAGLRREQRDRLARVSHVYWQWKRNPMLDEFAMFKQLCKGKYADKQSEWRAAQKDKLLFDFVIKQIAPPSRQISEARVRYAGNKLIEMGMQTDNGRDIAEGAKIIMKVDRLDQPESEQADMSKAMFIPPVVTTVASEIDPTKEDYNDEQLKQIMNKYGAYIDEKRIAVEEKTEVMLAKRGTQDHDVPAEAEEINENE